MWRNARFKMSALLGNEELTCGKASYPGFVFPFQHNDKLSPVVGQHVDVGDGDDKLQPAPVGDEVGEQGQEKDADTEEHLEEDTHRPSELHPHDLCD